MKNNPARNINPANKKNSATWDSMVCAPVMINTMMFPNDTVNNQKLVTTDFMLGGACKFTKEYIIGTRRDRLSYLLSTLYICQIIKHGLCSQ